LQNTSNESTLWAAPAKYLCTELANLNLVRL
jgi:hypothetical protein